MDANKIKKGLGRGLSSLIGETKAEININKVSISDLVSNKFQPRKTFDEESLQDLTNSIKERGIIQPIIVRKSSEDSSKYEIIAGERSLKYTKYQKNYTHSRGTPAKRNTSVDFGMYGLQCNEPTLLSLKQLETCRRTLRRVIARRAPI